MARPPVSSDRAGKVGTARRSRVLRAVWQVLLVAIVVVVAALLWGRGPDVMRALTVDPDRVIRWLPLILLLYAALMAAPFVPSVEIGIAILVLFGAPAAPFVWVATVAGLNAAFLIGAVLPRAPMAALLTRLRLERQARFILEGGTDPQARLDALLRHRPLALRLARYRYLALAVMLNLPGNIMLGGGGGLALIAGASQAFRLRSFVLTVMIATAPVPLAVAISGTTFMR